MKFHLVVGLLAATISCLPCITAVGYGDGPRDLTDNESKVLILGGGPAGIKAAATLIENGFEDIIILEGRDRLRGSLAPIEFDGKQFAPGSLWAYNIPDYLDRLDALGVSHSEHTTRSFIIRNYQGSDVTEEAVPRWDVLADSKHNLDNVAAQVNEGHRADISEKVGLAREGWVAASDIDRALEWFHFDFYSGVSTRDSSTAGPARQRDVPFDYQDRYLILDEGMTAGNPLLDEEESLFQEGHVRLGKVAQSVDYTDDTNIRVVTTDGSEYTGHFLVVAHTVGVLQQGGLTFNPPLPQWKTEEIFRAQMGTVDPIFMKFETKFWDDEEIILHATNRTGYYPAFLNLEAEGLYPEGTNILVGFLTGDEAYRAELLDDSEVQAEVMAVLKGMYGLDDLDPPTEFHMSRFATDPSLRGSSSTWPIGNKPEDAMLRVAGNVGRVYFALEDASSEYIGTPYGAVRSGFKAADAIHACYMYEACPVYNVVDPPIKPDKPNKGKKNRKDFNWNH